MILLSTSNQKGAPRAMANELSAIPRIFSSHPPAVLGKARKIVSPLLRAFRDYRFRGPHLMTVQAEYDRKLCEECTPCKDGIIRTVCSHLGLVLAYDAGKVALRKSDLDFSGMHQSFGGGIAIYLGKDGDLPWR
jgi:hypothetical protein